MVVFGALCLSKGMKELHKPLKASIMERPFLLLLAAGGLCAMGIAMQLLHWTGERKKRQEELQKAQQNQAASQFRPI